MIIQLEIEISFSNLLYIVSYSSIVRSSNILFLCYQIMHKPILTFGLLASSLVMLSAMPLFNNNAAFAQGYETYGDSSYSQYPTDDKNMNVEQVHSKAFLYLR